jgi:hypothetical protein
LVTRHSKLLQELALEPLEVALVQVPTYDVDDAVELGAAGAECSMPQAVRRSVAAIAEVSRERALFMATITKLYRFEQSCSPG